jgi:hypothetical protein
MPTRRTTRADSPNAGADGPSEKVDFRRRDSDRNHGDSRSCLYIQASGKSAAGLCPPSSLCAKPCDTRHLALFRFCILPSEFGQKGSCFSEKTIDFLKKTINSSQKSIDFRRKTINFSRKSTYFAGFQASPASLDFGTVVSSRAGSGGISERLLAYEHVNVERALLKRSCFDRPEVNWNCGKVNLKRLKVNRHCRQVNRNCRKTDLQCLNSNRNHGDSN